MFSVLDFFFCFIFHFKSYKEVNAALRAPLLKTSKQNSHVEKETALKMWSEQKSAFIFKVANPHKSTHLFTENIIVEGQQPTNFKISKGWSQCIQGEGTLSILNHKTLTIPTAF